MAEILREDEFGQSLLHASCRNLGYGSTKENVSAILGLGFDINAVDQQGRSCLIVFVQSARPSSQIWNIPGVIREQELLCFLLQHGADPYATIDGTTTVSRIVYGSLCNEWPCGHGSYHGDLWDSALHICGYDISKFRAGHPRRANYSVDTNVRFSARYSRAQFELLWQGREAQCPYWDDQPWPLLTGSDGDDYLSRESGYEDESDYCKFDGYDSTEWKGQSSRDWEDTDYGDESNDVDEKSAANHCSATADEATMHEDAAQAEGRLIWSLNDQQRVSWSQQDDSGAGDLNSSSQEPIFAALSAFELANPWLDDWAHGLSG